MDKRLLSKRHPKGQGNNGNVKHFFISNSKKPSKFPKTKKAAYWRNKLLRGIALQNKAFVTVKDLKSIVKWKTKKKTVIKEFKKINRKANLFKSVKLVRKTASPSGQASNDGLTTTYSEL